MQAGASLPDSALSQSSCEEARKAVLIHVDSLVSEKIEAYMAQGKQVLKQIQQRHKETTARLTEEVARCYEKQRSLEAENEKLNEALRSAATRLDLLLSGNDRATPTLAWTAHMGPVASPEGGPVFEGGSTVQCSPPPQAKDSSRPSTAGPFTPGGTTDTLGSPALGTPSEAAGCAADAARCGPSFPDVPRFPFPSQPQPPAATFSLAEALGAQAPQRAPLSLVDSLVPPPQAAPPSPAASRGSAEAVIAFTLRKADGADLGLNVSHREQDQVLRVEAVRPDGAVEAWNRQCVGNACPEKAVHAGDRIISVNSITCQPTKMLEECRDKQLLRLVVSRGGTSVPGMPAKVKTTSLRADASVFVPQSPDAASQKDGQGSSEQRMTRDNSSPQTVQVQETSERV